MRELTFHLPKDAEVLAGLLYELENAAVTYSLHQDNISKAIITIKIG